MSYGRGEYTYELIDNWAKPIGIESFIDVVGISIDSDDRIYVFNRSTYPMIMFDTNGNQLSCWGEGLFRRPHGSYLSPEGIIYCTDDHSHVVHKFSPEGDLILTIGDRESG